MHHVSRTSGLTRRQFVALTGALALSGLAGAPRLAHADKALLKEAMEKLIGAATPTESDLITLDLPEIAENGNTVPLKLAVDSPMSEDDYVEHVHVFAEGNPLPDVASFHFTPASGRAAASTRIRLAQTQNVVAVAQTSNGKVYIASKEVKVTIGGCGG